MHLATYYLVLLIFYDGIFILIIIIYSYYNNITIASKTENFLVGLVPLVSKPTIISDSPNHKQINLCTSIQPFTVPTTHRHKQVHVVYYDMCHANISATTRL